MGQARHTGKVVLTFPPARPGPGRHGAGHRRRPGRWAALVAGHLAATGRAGHLLLASRSGPAAPGAAALAAELAGRAPRCRWRPVMPPTGRRWPGCWPRSRPGAR